MHDLEELKDLLEANFGPDSLLDFLDIEFRDMLDRYEDVLIEREEELRRNLR